MSLHKEFIPYQESLELKELGFDEPCFGYYEPSKEFNYLNWEIFKDLPYLAKNSEWQDLCGAPTFSQAFSWFMEKHGLHINLFVDDDKTFGYMISYFIEEGRVDKPLRRQFKTHEEAEHDCLKKLIEIVKNK